MRLEDVWGDPPYAISGHWYPTKPPVGTGWSARRSEPSEARRALNSQTGAINEGPCTLIKEKCLLIAFGRRPFCKIGQAPYFGV